MNATLSKTIQSTLSLPVLSKRVSSTKTLRDRYQKALEDSPHWKASLFDDYFFEAKIVPMIKDAAKIGRQVDVKAITSAWANQINLNSRSRAEVTSALEPVINKILANLS